MTKFGYSLVALTVGCIMFAGVPIISWGISDLGGFFGNPARLTYLVTAVLLMLAIVTITPDSGRSRGTGEKPVPRQHTAVLLLQILSIAAVAVAPYCDRRGIAVFDGDAVRYAGLVLFIAGYILMAWAVAALGRQFSVEVTIQKDHRLVTTGLYGVLRHPRYTGIILAFSGIALVFASAGGLAVVALIAAVLAWRIRDEEAMMRREFGAEWDAYAAKTRRLIPLVF